MVRRYRAVDFPDHFPGLEGVRVCLAEIMDQLVVFPPLAAFLLAGVGVCRFQDVDEDGVSVLDYVCHVAAILGAGVEARENRRCHDHYIYCNPFSHLFTKILIFQIICHCPAACVEKLREYFSTLLIKC